MTKSRDKEKLIEVKKIPVDAADDLSSDESLEKGKQQIKQIIQDQHARVLQYTPEQREQYRQECIVALAEMDQAKKEITEGGDIYKSYHAALDRMKKKFAITRSETSKKQGFGGTPHSLMAGKQTEQATKASVASAEPAQASSLKAPSPLRT